MKVAATTANVPPQHDNVRGTPNAPSPHETAKGAAKAGAHSSSSSHASAQDETPAAKAAAPAQPETTRTTGSTLAEPAKAARAAGAAGEYVKTVKMAAAKPTLAPDIEIRQPSQPLAPVKERLRWLGHKIAATAFVTEILPGAGAKLSAYGALTRLNKPIGIWLLMWPVLWALWISSSGRPDPHVFIVFVLGTVLTRSAGCAINDFADRNFDGHVQRTKDRPLVTGAVDPMEAIAICAALGLIALGLALTLNELAQWLTLAGGILVVTYPFFKRFFPMPQAYLGIAFTWSVPMAFAAQTNQVSRIAIVMFLAGVAWTVAYDTMYAMVDREDDKKLGIRSSAILFGDADRFIIGIMQLMTLLGLWLIGHEMELGLWYGLGLAFAAMFALYQQLLIRDRKPDKCFRAFLNNNYFGMSVFIGILLEYTFR
nr:4-hydroxybenzoate octaprenyltransferase [Steroidobacter gossypii]